MNSKRLNTSLVLIVLIIIFISIIISKYLYVLFRALYRNLGKCVEGITFECYIGVNLMGGLGNNLFQIANGYSLAKRRGCKLFINNVNESIHSHKFSKYVITNLYTTKLTEQRVTEDILKSLKPYYEKREFAFDEIADTNIILTGYYQNEKYFMDNKEDIKHLLRPPHYIQEQLEKVNFVNIVAIHVRLGDFLAIPIHKIELANYYNRARQYIEARLNNPRYIIVSEDSMSKVIEHYPMFANLMHIEEFTGNLERDEMYDFYFMSNCVGLITANSTYSWWAGYMNDNKGMVIIPNKYILDRESTIQMEGAVIIEV